MKCFLGALMTTFVVVAFSTVAVAAGSGAYRLEVGDAEALGTGGAFVAEADTPAAVYYNPAGLTQIDGSVLSINAALIHPRPDHYTNDGDLTKMNRKTHLVPGTFFTTDLGTEKIAFGLGAGSTWGLSTEWAQDSALRYSATRSVLESKDYFVTTAYQLNDQWSVDLGVDINDVSVDKQKKLLQGGVGDDGNFRLKGTDSGEAYRFAVRYAANERHQFGLVYRTATELKLKGKVHLDDLNNAGTPYQAIFGGSSYETDVESKATFPQGVVLGYSYVPNEKWRFNLDVEWMDWSSTKEEELAYPSESDATRLSVLNNGNPGPRDWNSVISVALGTEYNMNERMRLRAGYFYHETPIPDDTYQSSLPDADSHSVTLGAGYDLTKALALDLAISRMFFKDRVVDADALGGTDGEYKQSTDLLLATLTYTF